MGDTAGATGATLVPPKGPHILTDAASHPHNAVDFSKQESRATRIWNTVKPILGALLAAALLAVGTASFFVAAIHLAPILAIIAIAVGAVALLALGIYGIYKWVTSKQTQALKTIVDGAQKVVQDNQGKLNAANQAIQYFEDLFARQTPQAAKPSEPSKPVVAPPTPPLGDAHAVVQLPSSAQPVAILTAPNPFALTALVMQAQEDTATAKAAEAEKLRVAQQAAAKAAQAAQEAAAAAKATLAATQAEDKANVADINKMLEELVSTVETKTAAEAAKAAKDLSEAIAIGLLEGTAQGQDDIEVLGALAQATAELEKAAREAAAAKAEADRHAVIATLVAEAQTKINSLSTIPPQPGQKYLADISASEALLKGRLSSALPANHPIRQSLGDAISGARQGIATFLRTNETAIAGSIARIKSKLGNEQLNLGTISIEISQLRNRLNAWSSLMAKEDIPRTNFEAKNKQFQELNDLLSKRKGFPEIQARVQRLQTAATTVSSVTQPTLDELRRSITTEEQQLTAQKAFFTERNVQPNYLQALSTGLEAARKQLDQVNNAKGLFEHIATLLNPPPPDNLAERLTAIQDDCISLVGLHHDIASKAVKDEISAHVTTVTTTLTKVRIANIDYPSSLEEISEKLKGVLQSTNPEGELTRINAKLDESSKLIADLPPVFRETLAKQHSPAVSRISAVIRDTGTTIGSQKAEAERLIKAVENNAKTAHLNLLEDPKDLEAQLTSEINKLTREDFPLKALFQDRITTALRPLSVLQEDVRKMNEYSEQLSSLRKLFSQLSNVEEMSKTDYDAVNQALTKLRGVGSRGYLPQIVFQTADLNKQRAELLSKSEEFVKRRKVHEGKVALVNDIMALTQIDATSVSAALKEAQSKGLTDDPNKYRPIEIAWRVLQIRQKIADLESYNKEHSGHVTQLERHAKTQAEAFLTTTVDTKFALDKKDNERLQELQKGGDLGGALTTPTKQARHIKEILSKLMAKALLTNDKEARATAQGILVTLQNSRIWTALVGDPKFESIRAQFSNIGEDAGVRELLRLMAAANPLGTPEKNIDEQIIKSLQTSVDKFGKKVLDQYLLEHFRNQLETHRGAIGALTWGPANFEAISKHYGVLLTTLKSIRMAGLFTELVKKQKELGEKGLEERETKALREITVTKNVVKTAFLSLLQSQRQLLNKEMADKIHLPISLQTNVHASKALGELVLTELVSIKQLPYLRNELLDETTGQLDAKLIRSHHLKINSEQRVMLEALLKDQKVAYDAGEKCIEELCKTLNINKTAAEKLIAGFTPSEIRLGNASAGLGKMIASASSEIDLGRLAQFFSSPVHTVYAASLARIAANREQYGKLLRDIGFPNAGPAMNSVAVGFQLPPKWTMISNEMFRKLGADDKEKEAVSTVRETVIKCMSFAVDLSNYYKAIFAELSSF